MSSKRKFVVSDEESGAGDHNIGGISSFNKHKSAKPMSATVASKKGNNNSNLELGSSCSTNLHTVKDSASGSSRKHYEEIGVNSTSSTNTNTTINNAQQKANDNTTGGSAQSKCGKTFAQTFAYLKNTDLYKLPPKPAAVEPITYETNSIIVNSRQKGNPILKFVKNVPFEYGEIIPDYQIGERNCALFLSLRYHNLNPEYIHQRLKLIGNRYELRVILVLVDIENPKRNLKELGKIGILSGCTLILAWSNEEAGRYLETYKQYENKPPDVLQERVETDYFAKMQDVLTTIKSINKTDVITLLSTFGSLRNIVNASKEEIGLCPGFGQQKAHCLYKVFHEPFKRSESSPNKRIESSQTCKLKRPKQASDSPQKSSPASKLKRPCQDDTSPQKSTEASTSSKKEEVNGKCSPTKQVNPNKVRLLTPKKLQLSPISLPTFEKPSPSPSNIVGNDANSKNDTSVEATLITNDFVVSSPHLTSPQPSPDRSQTSSSTKHLEQLAMKTSPCNKKSSYIVSKSDAVYNSGLSRNRSDIARSQSINKSKETPAISSEITNKSSEILAKKCANNESKIGKTLKSLSNTLIDISPRKPSNAMRGKAEVKKTASNCFKKLVQKVNLKPVSSNIAVGKSKQIESSRVSQVESTQLTLTEYEDLLASDTDSDDNVMY